jgi:exonuclease SbcD
MRILHTSDWHLGRIFQNIHLTDDQAYVLEQIKGIARERAVDVIVVAGDIYDRAVPPPEAVRLLDDTLYSILLDLKIPIIMIAGNHDSPDRLSFGSRLFNHHGLHLSGTLQYPIGPTILSDSNGPVAFYAIPYSETALVREKSGSQEIREHSDAMGVIVNSLQATTPASARRVICAHAFVQGGITQESERPICIGGSGSVDTTLFDGFTCTLLGHLHRPQWFKESTIHYSGSILPYSFSEADHTKSVSIIDIDATGKLTSEYIPLSPRHAVRCIDGTLSQIITNGASDPSPLDYLLIRLLDTEPILDAIGKLRMVYPNVMLIERPGLESLISEENQNRVDHRKLSDEDLFAAFFSQTTGVALNDAQNEFFTSIVQKVRAKEREVNT